MSTLKDILVANALIKCAVPILGLGLLAAMCSTKAPESASNTFTASNQTLCDKAIAQYEKNSSQNGWTAKEIACEGYSSTPERNPNIFKPRCINAVTTFLHGGGSDLEAACWPERVAALRANSPECQKLKNEYDLAWSDADLKRSSMDYREAAIAEGEAKRVKNLLEQADCAY
jgi:hypothetical protein